VVGTPIDLTRVLRIDKPLVRVRYELREIVPGRLAAEVERVKKTVKAILATSA
jgi:predicted GTPase